MSLRFIDRALVILLVLEVFVATAGTSAADPIIIEPPCPGCTPPGGDPTPSCDDKCRERRFTQTRYKAPGENPKTTCGLWLYRDCGFCKGGGLFNTMCMPNANDKYPDGDCKEINKIQGLADPLPQTCTAMCPIPLTLDNYYREAAEDATTYSSASFAESFNNVRKCKNASGQYQNWPDETD